MPSPNQYVAALPGRKSYPVVCHAGYHLCATCLQRIAQFLAREVAFDWMAALARPAAEYQADVAGRAQHGDELRRLTVRECFLQRPDFSGFKRGTTVEDIIVADEISLAPPASRLEAAA